MKSIYILSILFIFAACGTKQATNKKAETKTVKTEKTDCGDCSATAEQKQSCCGSASAKVESDKVTVFYFHGDRRCATCKAVGKVAKNTVEEKFANNSKVEFLDVNIDQAANAALAEKMKISGSALCIGNSTNAENITMFAFSNARSNPAALSQKVEELVKSKLK
ncbi:thioredoxin [Prolixibacteraceae bacterium JC049]|nr:thioredoxin [Prolixibacteraceae bacterium JC049]